MSKVKKISSCTIANRNNGKTAYVTQKIMPPTRPLSSTLVSVGIKARQEGKPIPNVNPQNPISIATSYLLEIGNIRSNEEITPKRTQKRRKRILLTLSAITGPISADTITVK